MLLGCLRRCCQRTGADKVVCVCVCVEQSSVLGTTLSDWWIETFTAETSDPPSTHLEGVPRCGVLGL